MKWTVAKAHEGMLVRDYLQQVHGFSRRILKAIKFDGGAILVNGVPQHVRIRLMPGDIVSIRFPKEEIGPYMQPEEMPLVIVYEDDELMVIDKPAGVATIPSMNQPTGTIANGVLAYYRNKNIPYTVHIVTRLDRDTSGLMLIAKHRYSHSLLAKMQKAHIVKRRYKAVVEGRLPNKTGTINQPIGRKEGSIIERTVSEGGKHAITHFRVADETALHSLVDINLETGRTHQIRVHFSYMGHPLAGDDLYGGSTAAIQRQALHCYWISIVHPITKEELKFYSAIPEDMMRLINQSD